MSTAVECVTEFGEMIKGDRIRMRLSQPKLARLVNASQSTISAIETGLRTYFINPEEALRYANVLKCDPKRIEKYLGYVKIRSKPKCEPETELAELIFSRCEQMGISVEEVAKKIYKTSNSLSQSSHLSYHSSHQLSKILGLDLSTFGKFIKVGKEKETKNVGKLIRQYRKSLGMSCEDLGERIGVSRESISAWETGKTCVSKDKIIEIAEALQINPRILIKAS